MCGILGLAGDISDGDKDRFARALARLEHRGPDDSGTHYTTISGGPNVALGHRRLSILDLSSLGHQPMRSPRTGSTLVYNGEIYNFAEVRAELRSLGYEFRSDSDTEVLLAAYDAWGKDCVTRLNGMFAFAILDVPNRRLVLARDRLGIKPLYYFFDGKRFAFGSELVALASLRLAPQVLRKDAIVNYLSLGYVPGDLTPLEQYAKLRAGFSLTYDLDRLTITLDQYWDALEAYSTQSGDDEHALTDQLESLLVDAVGRQQVSDVPLGAFLSGGVDSSLVVAMMCKAARGRVRTFTIGSTAAEMDEAPAARRVAQHLGTDHEERYLSADDVLPELPKVAAMYDEPFADTSAIPTAVVSRLMREHVTVALSGDGGDELFHGYPRYRRSRAFSGFQHLPRMARKAALGILSQNHSPRTERYRYLLGSPDAGTFYARRVSWRKIVPLESDAGDGPLWLDQTADAVVRRLARRPGEVPAAIDLLSCLPDDFLVKVDRASMAVSLEVRVPLLDHRIVEFAARTPSSMKVRDGVSKYLLKKVLERHVPRSLWERPKQGFSIPIGEWLRGPLKGWLQDELLSGDWGWVDGLVSRAAVQRLIDRHMRRSADVAAPLWALICWKVWTRRVADAATQIE